MMAMVLIQDMFVCTPGMELFTLSVEMISMRRLLVTTLDILVLCHYLVMVVYWSLEHTIMMAMVLIQDMFVCTPGMEVFTLSMEMISMGRLLVTTLDFLCHYQMMVIYWPLEHTNDGNGVNSGHVHVYSWNGSVYTQRGNDIDGEAAGDYSGYSVSLSNDGNILAIGAPYNDGNGADSGHVRVYSWNGSVYTQRGNDINGEAAGDYSGRSVSLSNDGNILAIGAYANDGNGGVDSGHVRVYSWNGSAYTQRGNDINGEAASDLSGWSVSLSNDGNILAIGAYSNDGYGNNSGHVRVYSWNGSVYTQHGNDIDGEAAGDYSGFSVSLSNDGYILAIGAYYDDGNGVNSGHVRVYSWNGSVYTQRGNDINGEAAGDYSGYFSLCHYLVMVVYWSLEHTIMMAMVLIQDMFVCTPGMELFTLRVEMISMGRLLVTTLDFLCHYQMMVIYWPLEHTRMMAMVLIQDMFVCTPGMEVFTLSVEMISMGRLLVTTLDFLCHYQMMVIYWPLEHMLMMAMVLIQDMFVCTPGMEVFTLSVEMISMGRLLVTTLDFLCHYQMMVIYWPLEHTNDGNGVNSGHVRVYSWNGSVYTQRGNDIDGEAAGDYSGYSVSLSNDGNILAIGAPYNDGNGADSGHVRVYSWNGSVYTQRGNDINGEAAGDYSGWSVSLSNDGNILAIGAYANDGNGGVDSGHVRVYSWNGSVYTQRGNDINGEAAVTFWMVSVTIK
ncbi:hypothetical protein ACHAXA_004414 [Cyclostephanos tholiformis]|uniref:Uncharacterized protein n=1 Tax=Cyclostephanos tholiformis TaxID=382380 RepID=A0ABD3R0S8_9STRA